MGMKEALPNELNMSEMYMASALAKLFHEIAYLCVIDFVLYNKNSFYTQMAKYNLFLLYNCHYLKYPKTLLKLNNNLHMP